MDSTQTYLTNLLLEIDSICKKYDIEYVIDYGTTLGAVRHEGFIPWDDDIDINMTEENYYKWVEACKKELDPNKRFYSDGRQNRDFPGVFGRYIDVESMRISSTFAFWQPICGQCIDVFYMLELPGDPVKKQKAIDLYFAYDEYANSSYRHYRSKTEEQMKLYKSFLRWEKIVGKERVLRYLEKQIFNKHYDDCDTYIVTSARKLGPSSIAPKECYDNIYMADFEGHKLPIAGKYVELMTHYYGDDWDRLPDHKKSHSKMSKNGINCKDYVDDYMRLIDEKELKKQRQQYKHLAVEEGYRTTKHMRMVYTKKGECELLKIQRKIAEKGINIKDYLVPDDKNKLAVLDEIFADYYNFQLNSSVRYWEVYVDITEELFYAAMFNLVYGRNNFTAVSKIMKIREANGVKNTAEVTKLWNLILTSRKIKAQIIYENYEDAKKLISDGLALYPHSKEIKVYNLIVKTLTAENEEDLSNAETLANSLLEQYPNDDLCIKALGDIAFARKDMPKAKEYYDYIMENSNNGMLHLDIKKKAGAFND